MKQEILLEEIKHSDLMSEKHKRHVGLFSGCVSTSAFPSLVDVPVAITISPVGIKICACKN